MRVIGAEEILQRATPERLVAALRAAFRAPHVLPPRQVASSSAAFPERLLLSMPAFAADGSGAVKLVTVRPDNPSLARPSIQAVVVAFDAQGCPRAVLDGTLLTRLRTAAASALASSYLSRADSSRLVLAGTGALAPFMAAAHLAVRPIRHVAVWGRDPRKAEQTAAALRRQVPASLQVVAVASLAEAVRAADIISCATSSVAPYLEGEWLRAGAFVDLVGSFTPQQREADDEVVRRSRLFVDTFEGALAEAGDLRSPLERGIIARGQIEAELADLVTGRHPGRGNDADIVTFKSVGTAIEDLAAARLVLGELP
ncbi:MAG: ornithine cyclodeaminase family protein [Gammaproteobacteria bacterium]|nr:ornithine cyclodeaminase family protein [Gammaproteobacteria bacterium]